MQKLICKTCGSTAVHYINVGFNGWFAFFWIGFIACVFLNLSTFGGIFLVLAVIKTILAFTQWKDACKDCHSKDVIPTTSPIGKKLLTEAKAD